MPHVDPVDPLDPVLGRLRALVEAIRFVQRAVPESLPLLRLALPGQLGLILVSLILYVIFRPALPGLGCGLTVPQALLLLLALELLTLLVVGLVSRIFGRFRIPPHFEKLAEALIKSRALDLILTSLLAGVAEELLFRGVLASLLGVIPSAVLFGVAHMPRSFGHFAILSGLGLLFSYEIQLSGGIALPMIHHAVHDVMVLSLLRQTLLKNPGALDEQLRG